MQAEPRITVMYQYQCQTKHIVEQPDTFIQKMILIGFLQHNSMTEMFSYCGATIWNFILDEIDPTQ